MTNDSMGSEGSYFEAKEKEKTWEFERKSNAIYPIFITFLYLLLGFSFHLWHPGWLMFLTIPLYYMRPKSTMEMWTNPVMITLIFLILGFFFGLWHPAWMLFFLIPISAILQSGGKKDKEGSDKKDE